MSVVQRRKFQSSENGMVAVLSTLRLAAVCFPPLDFIAVEFYTDSFLFFFFFEEWWELSIFTERKYCVAFVSLWNIIKIHSEEDELSWKFSWCALHVRKEASARDCPIVVVHWDIPRKDVNSSVSLAVMAAAKRLGAQKWVNMENGRVASHRLNSVSSQISDLREILKKVPVLLIW